MKVDSQLKEVEKLRYDLRNQRKTYFQAQQSTGGGYAAGVGASLMGKLNLPARASGYTPGMYASNSKPVGSSFAAGGNAGEGDSQGTDRSFQSRYAPGKVSEVGSSMEISKGGFLSQSMLGGKVAEVTKSTVGLPAEDLQGDTSLNQNNMVSTPSSKNEDADMPNLGDE